MKSCDDYLPWGTLTGIRPSKVAEKLFISGEKEQSVLNILQRKYFVLPEKADLCIKTALATLSLKKTLTPRDISLYIGIPFCPTRCAYCSFVSNSVKHSMEYVEPFIETLLDEIKTVSEIINKSKLRINSVYIGGGTPTALSDDDFQAVMCALKSSFDLSALPEYTVEAGRPDTITEQKLKIMEDNGAGRICVNPQSMSVDVLSEISRKHSPADVVNAVNLIKKTKMSLNMDVIAGLPTDTTDGFKQTLCAVLDFAPENITVHTLSLKKGSKIMLENTEIPSGEVVGEMLDYAAVKLSDNEYNPYYLYRQKYISGGFENTGWSLSGHECIYNKCMMDELCTVIALGGGGVTKLITPDGKIERIFNAKYPREYIMMTEKMKEKTGRIEEYAVSV